MQAEILAEVIRGETVESIHRGHLIVVSGDGEIVVADRQPGNGNVFSFVGETFSDASIFDERRGGKFRLFGKGNRSGLRFAFGRKFSRRNGAQDAGENRFARTGFEVRSASAI